MKKTFKKQIAILLTILTISLLGTIKIENKKLLSNNNSMEYKEYKVKQGDSIERIAKKYATDTISVKKMKTKIQIKNNIGEVIYPGDILLVPTVAN
ncbi:LysM peptidoglycan-binding domain-containing protein [Clostridium botulinum]|uniref:LysM peptidoglycan-binding domain-containing protein n=1 Tax=Clostridium botulinum TaxID=1491 RepID=A0A846JGR4_CLOBO|nr:LysM peptidoglycan-binding domain-containing protein [Clostridium botulinum]ACA57402.1 LysM domain protein [Clostridium botulinum A3 str. Loch Maree]NFH65497.1 LysM peptidoglycan-binding domain-containing protein [Clostridium botulinum]NFJ09354.1 LysM peptidoglycan-binding domain-containing protein [Clostridium botulinum]NFK16625.1 LysM peptidoglycan-binding domain-containing protein [Clostridium botulinum]NFM94350.1 LysM peptidoglycan-binding domain-containing protein [Clostridium botulinu